VTVVQRHLQGYAEGLAVRHDADLVYRVSLGKKDGDQGVATLVVGHQTAFLRVHE